MSADRWSECPICIRNHKKKITEKILLLEKELNQNYGNVPKEKFYALQEKTKQKIQNLLNKQLEDSLMEYFTIGVSNQGLAYADYSGQCTVCKTQWSFKTDSFKPLKEKARLD